MIVFEMVIEITGNETSKKSLPRLGLGGGEWHE